MTTARNTMPPPPANPIGTVIAGSLPQASARLGVHRNTVLSRVARAREPGVALDDPEQRLALHILCHSPAPRAARPA